MNLPAGQHFVPRMLLKRFAGPEGRLWAYDKRRPDRGIWGSTPKDLLKERHLYTVTRPDGSRDVSVEQAFGLIESMAEPIIEHVVQRARAGLTPSLYGEDRGTLLLFLYIQHKRIPDFFRTVLSTDEVVETVRDSIAEWEQIHGPLGDDEKAQHLAPSNLAQLEQGVRMRTMLALSPLVAEALDSRGFLIGAIKRPDRQFVIGSNPIVRFRSRAGSTALNDPEVELWLPLAADVAIASYGRRGEEHMMGPLSDVQIRQMNTGIARQSTTVVSGSRALLSSLTRRLPEP